MGAGGNISVLGEFALSDVRRMRGMVMRWTCGAGVVVMAALAAGCGQKNVATHPTIRGDAEAIQGRWVVASCVVNGEPLTPTELEQLHWTFTGHELVWSDGSNFYYALDPATSPKSIDLRFPENPTEVTRGVYAFDAAHPEMLSVCISKTDERPASLESPRGARRYLYVLRREPAGGGR
jgi:uncharacterized protein (TIGR03067 family)